MTSVGIIGNPNVGKTALFNALTGAKQHVANWPDVTVEKKTGKCKHGGEEMEIVDLPGTYSLTARAIDELVARNYIVEENPDVVIDIVDASNLERNLYLTLLLIELEANVVVALNMWDVVESRGDKINVKKISELLGIPVVPTIATTGEGIEELKDEIVKAAKKKEKKRKVVIGYGEDVEDLIRRIEGAIYEDERLSNKYPSRWLAIKILEGDEDVLKRIEESSHRNEILKVVK
jgi:ferrous iron transport protein B